MSRRGKLLPSSVMRTTRLLGWIANVEYMGMFIADDAGYYKEEWLDMEIVPGGPAVAAGG